MAAPAGEPQRAGPGRGRCGRRGRPSGRRAAPVTVAADQPRISARSIAQRVAASSSGLSQRCISISPVTRSAGQVTSAHTARKQIARSPGWQGPAGPGPGRDGASFRDSAGGLAGCGLGHGHWLGQQQFADVAAEYRADDVQLIELDLVGRPDHRPDILPRRSPCRGRRAGAAIRWLSRCRGSAAANRRFHFISPVLSIDQRRAAAPLPRRPRHGCRGHGCTAPWYQSRRDQAIPGWRTGPSPRGRAGRRRSAAAHAA